MEGETGWSDGEYWSTVVLEDNNPRLLFLTRGLGLRGGKKAV